MCKASEATNALVQYYTIFFMPSLDLRLTPFNLNKASMVIFRLFDAQIN